MKRYIEIENAKGKTITKVQSNGFNLIIVFSDSYAQIHSDEYSYWEGGIDFDNQSEIENAQKLGIITEEEAAALLRPVLADRARREARGKEERLREYLKLQKEFCGE